MVKYNALAVLSVACTLLVDGTKIEEAFSASICSPSRSLLSPAFSYEAPEDWDALKSAYRTCGTGYAQSPVNVQVNYTKTHGMAPIITQKLSVLEYRPTSHNFKLPCATHFGQCSRVKFRCKT